MGARDRPRWRAHHALGSGPALLALAVVHADARYFARAPSGMRMACDIRWCSSSLRRHSEYTVAVDTWRRSATTRTLSSAAPKRAPDARATASARVSANGRLLDAARRARARPSARVGRRKFPRGSSARAAPSGRGMTRRAARRLFRTVNPAMKAWSISEGTGPWATRDVQRPGPLPASFLPRRVL
jgi:hypothetical protein